MKNQSILQSAVVIMVLVAFMFTACKKDSLELPESDLNTELASKKGQLSIEQGATAGIDQLDNYSSDPDHNCGSEASDEALNELRKRAMNLNSSGSARGASRTYNVPIKAHIVRLSDGSRGLALDELIDAIDSANVHYADAGLNFYLKGAPNYIDDTGYYYFWKSEEEEAMLDEYFEYGSINCFFVNTILGANGKIGGYAPFPGDGNHIVITNSALTNKHAFSHELGHHFGLFHTHHTGYGKELVNGINSAFAGDLIIDTPADPNLSGKLDDCRYTSAEKDANGDVYEPMIENLMSYGAPCRNRFTPVQILFAASGFVAYRLPELTFSPDLTILNASVSTNTVAPGNTLTFYCDLKNEGDVKSTSSSTRYYISVDTEVDDTDISLIAGTEPALGAGSSRAKSATITIPSSLANGNYHILIVADANEQNDEIDETNNIGSYRIKVRSLSDLIIEDPVVSANDGGSIVSGEKIDITCKVTNKGGVDAADSKIEYYLSTNPILGPGDTKLGTKSISTVEGRSSTEHTATFRLPSEVDDMNYILIVADAKDQVEEGEEDNNMDYKMIDITPAPDMVVRNASLSNSSILRGQTLKLDCDIMNEGTKSAGRKSYVKMYLSTDKTYSRSDTYLGKKIVANLSSGSTATTSLTISTLETMTWGLGNKYILFVADDGNLVREGNENNNLKIKRITIKTGASIP